MWPMCTEYKWPMCTEYISTNDMAIRLPRFCNIFVGTKRHQFATSRPRNAPKSNSLNRVPHIFLSVLPKSQQIPPKFGLF